MVLNMSNLIEIQSQIEKLQKQATEIKTREFAITVQDILAKMQAFGITVKDLQGGKVRSTKNKGKIASGAKILPGKTTKREKPAAAIAAKFRGPNGETWSGRGLTPRWLTALLAQGRTKEEFAIRT
jgi:DNA-binding protein H-NS